MVGEALVTLAELQEAARSLGITMHKAKELRRQFLALSYLELVLASRYGEPLSARADAAAGAERLLVLAHVEEDTLYRKGEPRL